MGWLDTWDYQGRGDGKEISFTCFDVPGACVEMEVSHDS